MSYWTRINDEEDRVEIGPLAFRRKGEKVRVGMVLDDQMVVIGELRLDEDQWAEFVEAARNGEL